MLYINNEKKINKLKETMNKENTCIFIDYDRTITSSNSVDSWMAIVNKKVADEKLLDELNKCNKKYSAIELDYTINEKDKDKYMLEWYQGSMNLYYKYNITKEQMEKSIYNSNLSLRKGGKDFLTKLHENNVLTIILSAGIGNVIEQSLREEQCNYNNIHIISNFIKFDKNGNMKKFQDNLIYTCNKNIDKLQNLKKKEEIEKKEYRIVIGDLIEDIAMMGEYPEEKSLKIGFLNGNISENLKIYNENFDIVLTEENNFYDIEKILKI